MDEFQGWHRLTVLEIENSSLEECHGCVGATTVLDATYVVYSIEIDHDIDNRFRFTKNGLLAGDETLSAIFPSIASDHDERC